MTGASPAAPNRRRRWIEMLLLFGLLPGLLSLAPRWTVLVAILASGAVCLGFLLNAPSFVRRRLGDVRAARAGLSVVLIRAAVVLVALLVVVLATRGAAGLFMLPRTRPGLWLVLAAIYPALSVYPQEIVFRAFFFHRYAELFERPAWLILANAVLFGWAHVIVHNRTAMLLTVVGGVLLATTYQRSRSVLLVTVEHAFYGVFVLSVGLGGMFVNGVRLLSTVIK